MPGLLVDMEPPAAATAKGPEYGFTVENQKVELDIDFSNQSLTGRCELTIIPLRKDLEIIKIDARQCVIIQDKVTVNGKYADINYQDPSEKLDIPKYIRWTANQYEMQQHRLKNHDIKGDGPLQLTIPPDVKIEESSILLDNGGTPVSQRPTGTSFPRSSSMAILDPQSAISTSTPKPATEQTYTYKPLVITIPFSVSKFRDGLHFVGVEEGDQRFPHVYTRHRMDPGTASCIFPCIDDPAMRCSWDIMIRCSRTLGDALKRKPIPPSSKAHHHGRKMNGLLNGTSSLTADAEFEVPLNDEEKLLDMAVICSGELVDEMADLEDSSKKVVTFRCERAVAAHHIGFAIGPFQQFDLGKEYREEEDDEKLGQGQALPVWGYCLPGRTEELKDTCFNVVHMVDWYVLTFGSFPFSEAKLVFVDDQINDVEHTASLSLCSSRLLYPKEMIDPEREVTRTLAHALASQWIGVGIVPVEATDRWVTIGISHFMAGIYMKTLCGNNDYMFRQKTESDRLVEMDIDRPPLTVLGNVLSLGPFEYEFMALKAPLVLFILDKRIIKAMGSAGLARVITKLIMTANTGGEPESVISTESFRKLTEKITKYRQTEAFWTQWVFGSGCPRFQIQQKFNKKRSCVEMKIMQKQSDLLNQPRTIPKEDFLREFREAEVDAGEIQRFFTGPMTIRIHEADGTPYEHIVEIRGPHESFEIPYATKYKRLKRNRRQKERAHASMAANVHGDTGEDTLYYCLGDVLQSEEDVKRWGLSDWSESEVQAMENENYEWFRIDADFEWLCSKEFISMPSYMYISQLGQDRDVVAHQEAMLFLKSQPAHPLVSTFCLRTLMDTRYNHNIRVMAAEALRYHAAQNQSWVGLRHLEMAYAEFFCYPESKTPKPNDFTDIPGYFVSKAIVTAISGVRGLDGRCPKDARGFILDQLRFNDNQNNSFNDNYKVAGLLAALAESVIPRKVSDDAEVNLDDADEDDNEPREFLQAVIEELDRYRRMDEWISSYQNIYTTTVLDCKWKLMKAGVIEVDGLEFAKYIHDGTSDLVRIKAFEAMLDLGFITNTNVIAYMMNIMSSDTSPYVRRRLFEVFCLGLAVVAFGKGPDKPIEAATAEAISDGLVVEEDISTEYRKAHQIRTTTIAGALAGLKKDLQDNAALKEHIWTAVRSPKLTLNEQLALLEICGALYNPVESMELILKLPAYWKAEITGKVCFLLRVVLF